ncbi:MAG: tetratricopeptide repeat protein, partial [Flavobacteriales bacterium]|nr:tetratricopeptide repeat protein [Flavobacteriales bacterium]
MPERPKKDENLHRFSLKLPTVMRAPNLHVCGKTALLHLGSILSIVLLTCTRPAAASPAEQPSAVEIDPQGKAEIDSLLDASWALARVKPNESLAMLGRIEDIQAAIDTAYKADVVDYYYGVFYKNLSRYRESEASFNRYEAYHKNKEHLSRVAAVNMVKANLYSDMGDVARSMESVAYALQLYESLEDTLGIIVTGSKLGFLLAEAGRTEEAKNYHRRSQRLAQRIDNFAEEGIAYTNLALVYEKEGVNDSALTYHTLAYLIAERHDDAYSKSLNRHNMANILTMMNRPREALPYAEACMAVSESLDLPTHRVAAMSLLANVWLELGETEKAVVLLDSAVHGPYEDLGLRDRIELYAVRAKAYRQQEDYKAAYENFTTYKSLSDSLLNLESRSRLNELEIAYENDKQKQLISFLDLENQASKALISQKDRTILVGGIGLVLLLAFSAGLYLLQRKYLRQKAVLAKALDDKDLLLREIHHRVKNNLQVVSSLLSLQGRSLDDATAREAVIAGKSRVRSMALIHQDLYL